MARPNALHVLSRLCIILVILSLVVATVPPPAVRAAPDIRDLVRAYEASLGGSPQAQQEAALALFQRYGEYKKLVVTGGGISKETARALDERLVGMTQQIWRDVSVRHGSGLSHIVPVGTLGDRLNNPAYIPGKSDKDFIPRGSKASEAARDFMEAFERKFGIPAASVDVNALDPTNISKWPDRVLAASNFEKYNTKGGIAWLEREMYNNKPDLWRFDSLTGKVEQVKFDRLVKTPPPSLNPEDAAGFFSDNMKFRQHLAEEFAGDPRALSLKQAKYDQRNVSAFVLSGGELTQAEKDMLKCTELMRNGHVDEAARMYARLIGEADPQKALLAYREAMESLTERMARSVIEKHVALMASGKLSQAGADELAAAIANMPKYRGLVEEAVTQKLGKAEWNEINKIAQAFGERVSAARFGIEYFNEQAMKYFGKPYDKLSDAQRAILHGAEEAAETSGVSVGRILGTGLSAAFSAWAIHSSYTEGAKQGTATGIAHAAGRTFIELLQLGYPPAQIAELVGLVAAGLINYAAGEYKNSVLDALYAAYKANPSETTLRDLLDTQSILGYYAGGIREFAKSLRMDDANLTDDQIRQKLREYMIGRLEADKMQERVADMERWVEANDIPLLPGGDWISALGDNRELKAKDPAAYYRLMGSLLAAYDDWAARLRADGILFTDETIKHILWLTYRGTPEDLAKFLEELYARSPTPCKLSVGDGQLGRIISARDATLNQATPSRGGAIAKPQVLVSTSGAFVVPKDPDAPCGPGKQFGPFEVAGSGTISGTVDGDPPVPNVWSLYNGNTSLGVYFQPKVGQGYRPGDKLLTLSGQMEDSHLKGTADWSGPGRMWITIGPPSGSGPLFGGCFDQSYSAQVSVVAIKPENPARPDDRLQPGDQLITGPGGEVVVQLPDCSRLLVKPNSTLTFSSPEPGVIQVHVTRGGFRLQRPPRGVHGLKVKLGDRVATPVGTEFEVLVTDEGETINVIDGAVSVSPQTGGEATLIQAGQRGQWPGGVVTPYDASAEPPGAGLVAGLPLSQILTDDDEPEPYGARVVQFADGQIPSDWAWQDPGNDVQVETPEPGALRLTVPDNNDLWDNRAQAPRLLHKVTGDFDLQAEVRLDCAGTDMSSLEFLLYSPGSAYGDLAQQMRGDSLAANYRIIGGGWYRGAAMNKLLRLGQSWQNSVDAPAEGFVRLRLTRRGDLWKTYWSRDGGATWILSWREELAAPDTVWVGWLVKRMAWDGLHDQPAIATLRDMRLTTGPRGELPGPGWDAISSDGSAFAEDDRTLAVSMDGSAIGFTGLHSAVPLTGDFDVVARFDVSPPQQPGESRYVQLGAKTADEKQIAVALLLENDSVQSTLVTNLMRDGGWLGERRQPPYDTTRLRIARQNDRVTTYRWVDCGWVPMTDYEAVLSGPMYLVLGAGNDWDKTPSAVQVRWTVEQITADESPFGTDWAPATCSVLSAASPPAEIQFPAGMRTQWLTAPFGLDNLFFGPDGMAYVFSKDKGRQTLLAVTPDGEARPYARSELLAGINRKGGAWVGGRVLVGLDYWPESGNPFGGLFWLSPDGSFSEWKLSANHGGIAELIAAPGGGAYLADFENDGVWYVSAEGQPEQQLIAPENMLPGVGALALDGTSGALYALNWTGDWPFGGQAGVYRLTGDGRVELIATPRASVNFGGLAVSPGGPFAPGLYVSETDSGEILRIEANGALTPVVSGLPKPGPIRFSPTTGALWVVCDGKAVWVGGAESPAERPAGPVEAGPSPDAQWSGFFGADATPAAQPSPTTEAGGFFGGDATPEPPSSQPTAQSGPMVQPTAQGEPLIPPTPTVALPLPGDQPGIAAFSASTLEAQPGEWVTLSWQTSGGQPHLFRLDAAGQPKPESSDHLNASDSMDVPIQGDIGSEVTFVLGLLSPQGDKWLATATATVRVTGAAPLPSPEPVSVGADWAGAWQTDWGVVTLQVNGNQVTGSYPHDQGRLQGTLSPDGWTLEGTWAEAPSFQPPNDAGRFIFTLAQDKQSWSGKWGYGDAVDYGDWTGVRVAQPPAASHEAAPPTTDPYQPPQAAPQPATQAKMGPFTFSSDFDESTRQPSNVGQVFPVGTLMVWVSWPYQDFPAGLPYKFEWYHDGQLFQQGQNQFWQSSGVTWEWVIGEGHSSLAPGTYTFVLYINNQRYEIGSVRIQ